MWTLREGERELGRISECAHALHGVGRAVRLRDGGDRRVRTPVRLVHVVEHLLAAVVLEVDVDVGRLGLAAHADLGDEALEEQPVLHRVDGGDAEAEGDGGVGGAAASLAEDAALAREADGVPHDEEEAGEAEPADHLDLLLELRALLVAEGVPHRSRAPT